MTRHGAVGGRGAERGVFILTLIEEMLAAVAAATLIILAAAGVIKHVVREPRVREGRVRVRVERIAARVSLSRVVEGGTTSQSPEA
jgi:hypothetical protein